MLKTLQRFLTLLLLFCGGLYLLYQGFLYSRARELMPPGTIVAGVDVTGLSREQAAEHLQRVYLSPIAIYHKQERVEVNPQDVGFALDIDGMLQPVEAHKAEENFWQGYLEFLLGRSLEPVEVELRATHDRGALAAQLQVIASFLDQPAKSPQLLGVSDTFKQGEPGFVTDVEASLADVEVAVYRPDNREAHLVINTQEPPPFDLNLLANNINRQLESFDGIGSVFIMNLQTGEELSINADLALSGLSILKIAIFVEAYRALDAPPDDYTAELFHDTAVRSSNYGANLLLHVVAGENNTYRGADILTESMRRLGLVNTFMAIPYDAVAPATRPNTYATPANSRSDIPTQPDPTMQTTAEEIGTLLSMIYYCAKGGGALLAVYPGEITPDECQAIMDLMILNEEGNLIRFGVPDNVPVSHKHGWDAYGTHGDAGIVFSPSGDYVIVEYVHRPGGGWLETEISFPILREISRAAYNYFNFDDPYLGNALREDQFDPDGPNWPIPSSGEQAGIGSGQ
ncbi:MAG TPA: serine hydrolase [Anaerolineae bacterium]